MLVASQVLQCYDSPGPRDITNEILGRLSDVELIDPVPSNFLEGPAKALSFVGVPFLPDIPGLRVDENFPVTEEGRNEVQGHLAGSGRST